jgi:hypothetical protein
MNWTDKMEEVKWVYVLRGEKKPRIKLVSSTTNKKINIVEELSEFIKEARYAQLGAERAAQTKPHEAILALEDYRAGRTTANKARNSAVEYLATKIEAAMEDWESRQASAK